MTMKKTQITGLFLLLAVLALAGCKSFDGDKVRREHAENYPKALAEMTEESLARRRPLGLEDCIRIALAHSFDARSAEIRQRVATLERKIAFANFLPVLSVGYSHYEFDPEIHLELDDNTMNIDRVRSVTWEANMSIFNPATWFMYSLHKRGEEIAALVSEYTRQVTALQVTMLYFQCLCLEEMGQALDSELAAAQQTQKELAALYAEGMISEWQADQAGVFVQSRRVERDQTRRKLRQAKAELLAAMGLSPMADIALETETPLQPPAGSVEDRIATALLNHPQLKIADRNIEIQHEQVKVAVANFLPQLFGFVMFPNSLEDFVETSDQWIYGLSGTMTLFNGLANVNEYKAARAREEESFLAREQTTLSIMLEVLRAHLTLETVEAQAALAQQAYQVAAKRLAETEQNSKEGLVKASELLDQRAKCDRAHMQALNARFQYQVTTATLLNVMGQTKIDYEEPQYDGQS